MENKKKYYRKTVSFKTNEIELFNFLVSKGDYSGYIKSLIKHAKALEEKDIDILTFGIDENKNKQKDLNLNQGNILLQLLNILQNSDSINLSGLNADQSLKKDTRQELLDQLNGL